VTVGDGVIAFLAAFCGGWIAARLAGVIMYYHKAFKAERDRKARLEWFKRRSH
jgi:hypothetical protein